MLAALSIRDIVLIDRLELDLAAGLCVLTGETGAGKSILLDALGLATGNRADRGLVRHTQNEGSATAIFEVPLGHAALERLNQAELMEPGETNVILRRVQRADGPSRAFINDRPVSVALLQEIGSLLLEFHGQGDGRGLLDATGHRALLDGFGGLEAERLATRKAWDVADAARRRLEDQKAHIETDVRDTDYLNHIIGELEALNPEEGEEEHLATRRARAMNAEKIAGDVKAAAHALGDDIEARAGAALGRLERSAEQAEAVLSPAIQALSRLLDNAAEAQTHLDAALRDLVFDQDELDRLEERLFALRAAARKHQCRVEQLPRVLEDAKQRLEAIRSGTHRVAELEATLKQAEAKYSAAARALGAKRGKAAVKLDAAVAKELAPLKLDKARFRTNISPASPGPDGADRVVFEVATNPGAPLGALTRVASGGEMSRFVLALKVALAAVGTAPTLIFDEIDHGVGGAVADAIGKRLAQLAAHAGAQIIVVTHSPQIAARAATHWRIFKTTGKNQALTRIEVLDKHDRREEIARMLSAAEITDEARAAAEQLLGTARAGRMNKKVRKA